MIHIFVDIDGTIIAENVHGAFKYYDGRIEYLPKSWRDYHQNHVITFTYENKEYHHLLLPGVLEMLRCFSIHLKEKVCISFFSYGIKARNEFFCKELMQRVAKDAGVDFESIDYKVYSRNDCIELPKDSELQPCSGNNPHIPENCYSWSQSDGKKVLSKLFDDISNVILIDDQYGHIINGETANHLKAVYCNEFPSFRFFREKGLSQEQKFLKNQEFLSEQSFYAVNQASYITGLVLAMIRRCEQAKISASEALESLQLCPHTHKYKQALYHLPVFNRYEPRYFEEGFLTLQAINPSLEFFAPYPHLALDALRCQKEYVFIDDNLRQATAGRYPEKIYDLIHKYHDTLNVCSSRQGFFNTRKSIYEDETAASYRCALL